MLYTGSSKAWDTGAAEDCRLGPRVRLKVEQGLANSMHGLDCYHHCRCAVLHGGRNQEQRETAIKGFRDDTYNILIATDVAGRGMETRVLQHDESISRMLSVPVGLGPKSLK